MSYKNLNKIDDDPGFNQRSKPNVYNIKKKKKVFVAAGWQFNKYKSLVKSNWNELSQCSRFILYDYLKQYDHKIKLIFRVTNNNTKSLNTKNNYKAQNDACVCV